MNHAPRPTDFNFSPEAARGCTQPAPSPIFDEAAPRLERAAFQAHGRPLPPLRRLPSRVRPPDRTLPSPPPRWPPELVPHLVRLLPPSRPARAPFDAPKLGRVPTTYKQSAGAESLLRPEVPATGRHFESLLFSTHIARTSSSKPSQNRVIASAMARSVFAKIVSLSTADLLPPRAHQETLAPCS